MEIKGNTYHKSFPKHQRSFLLVCLTEDSTEGVKFWGKKIPPAFELGAPDANLGRKGGGGLMKGLEPG